MLGFFVVVAIVFLALKSGHVVFGGWIFYWVSDVGSFGLFDFVGVGRTSSGNGSRGAYDSGCSCPVCES